MSEDLVNFGGSDIRLWASSISNLPIHIHQAFHDLAIFQHDIDLVETWFFDHSAVPVAAIQYLQTIKDYVSDNEDFRYHYTAALGRAHSNYVATGLQEVLASQTCQSLTASPSPSLSQSNTRSDLPCPRCKQSFKNDRALQRHARRVCICPDRYICVDCPDRVIKRWNRWISHREHAHGSEVRDKATAMRHLHVQRVLGCGFCIETWEVDGSGERQVKDYIQHVNRHLKNGDPWTTTTHLRSLLRQHGVADSWSQKCAERFGPNVDIPWEQAQWTDGNSTNFILWLEDQAFVDRAQKLEELFELGFPSFTAYNSPSAGHVQTSVHMVRAVPPLVITRTSACTLHRATLFSFPTAGPEHLDRHAVPGHN